MRLSPGCAGRAALAFVCLSAVASAGCSSSSGRFNGPSWNLTGGKGSAPIPERSIHQTPQQAGLPAPDRQPPVYRGGRDPVSGRAPAWGAPQQGFGSQPPQQAVQPAAQPSHGQPPVYQPPAYQPPAQPSPATQAPRSPSAALAPGQRIEVRPGQSLAMIASEQRVSISALMHANKLRDPYVIPGQQLVLPAR